MIDSIFSVNNWTQRTKITIKSIIAIVSIVMCVVLPQIVHVYAGSIGGAKWLPMYLPVLLASCLLGVTWGLGIGILGPVFSYLITSLTGTAMPSLFRLPYMVVELMVWATLAGVLSNKMSKNPWLSILAVILAQVCGRGIFLVMAMLFGGQNLTVQMALGQIQSGVYGLVSQIIIVPVIIFLLSKLTSKTNE